MEHKNEIYANPPLVETVFEIRFPPELAIECNKDKFCEQIRDMYPKVSIPLILAGKTAASEPYRFDRDDGTYGIMLAIDKIAVYCKKYEGFNQFKMEVSKVLLMFGKMFKIKNLDRTGLRYINIIPFVREKEVIPIENYLNIKIQLPQPFRSEFKHLGLMLVSQTDGGSITTRIEPAMSLDKTQEAIILDFDYAKDENLSFQSIEEYIEESHQHTKRLFEGLITDGYRKVMRGEVI